MSRRVTAVIDKEGKIKKYFATVNPEGQARKFLGFSIRPSEGSMPGGDGLKTVTAYHERTKHTMTASASLGYWIGPTSQILSDVTTARP